MGELPIMVLMTLLYGGTIHPDPSTQTQGSGWSYHGSSEPNNWHKSYPTCSGSRQSPINIKTTEVRPVNWLKPFVFYNYPSDSANSVAATLVNNGHTASLALASQWYVGGSNLKERYQAAEVHFHWAATDQGGSEHSVNGYKHAMEIQMIFFATKYGNMSNAIRHHDGLASIAVFADVSSEDNPIFEDLIGSLHKVSDNGKTSDLLSFRLTDFLPHDSQTFYHYMGSLTTPPCHESVMWYVMRDRISLSSRQIDAFRSLQTGVIGTESNTVEKIRDNVRPIQPLFGRTVFSSKRSLTIPPLNKFTKHIISKRAVAGIIRPQFKLSGRIDTPFSFARRQSKRIIAPAVVEEKALNVGHFFGQKKSVSSMNTQVQPIANINQKSSHTNHIIDPAAGSGSAPAWKSIPSSAGTASKSNWAWPGTQTAGSWSSGKKELNVPPPPPTELSTTTTSEFELQFRNKKNKIETLDLTSNVQFGAVQGISVQPSEGSARGNRISNTPKIGGTPNDPHMEFGVQPEVQVTKIGGPETKPTTAARADPTIPVTVPVVETTLSPVTPDPSLVQDTRIPTAATLRVERQHIKYPTTMSPVNAHQTWPITEAAPANGGPVKTPQQQAPMWSARQNEPVAPAEPPSQSHPIHEPAVGQPTTVQSPQTTTRAWQSRVSEPAIQNSPRRSWQSGAADLTKTQSSNGNTWQSSPSQSSWHSGGSQVSGSVQQRTWNSPGSRGWQSRFRQPAPALTQKTPSIPEWQPHASNQATKNQGNAAATSVSRSGQSAWKYDQNWQNKAQVSTVPRTQNTANKWETPARTPAATPTAPQPSPTPSGLPNNSTIEDAVGWFVAQLKSGAFQSRHQQLWDLLETAITQYKKDTAKPGMEQKISELNAKLEKLGGRLRNSVTLAPNPQTYSQHQNGQSPFVSSPESPQGAQSVGSYVQPRQQQQHQQARGFQYHEVPPQRSAHRKHDPPRSQYNQDVKSVNSMNKIDRGVNAASVSLSNLHGKNSPETITVPQDITVFTPVNGGNPDATPVPNHQALPSSMNNPQHQQVSKNAEFHVAQPNQVQQQQHGYEPNTAPTTITFEQVTTMATPTTTIKVLRKKPTFSVGNSKTASSFKISGGSRFSAKSFSAHKAKSSLSFSPKRISTWSDPAAKLKQQLRLRQEQQRIQEQKEKERLLEQQRQEQLRLEQEQQRQEQLRLEQEQQRQEQLRLEQEQQRQEQLRLEQEQQRQEQLRLQQEQQHQEQLRLQQEQRNQQLFGSQSQQHSFQGQQQQHMFNPAPNPFEQQQQFQQSHNQLHQPRQPQNHQQHFQQQQLQQQELQQQQQQQQLQQQELQQQQQQQQQQLQQQELQLQQQQIEKQQLQQQQIEQQLQQQQIEQQQRQQQLQQQQLQQQQQQPPHQQNPFQQQQQPWQQQPQQQPQQQQAHQQQQFQPEPKQQHPFQQQPWQQQQQQPQQQQQFPPEQQQQQPNPQQFQPHQQHQQQQPPQQQFPSPQQQPQPQQPHQQQQFPPHQQQQHQQQHQQQQVHLICKHDVIVTTYNSLQ